jgi:hypothetical protein
MQLTELIKCLGNPEEITLLDCWTTRGSAVSFCWAKVGEAKLIANPTRVTTERIFIGFLQVF